MSFVVVSFVKPCQFGYCWPRSCIRIWPSYLR